VPAPTDVDHSVWDEPSLVAGQADGGETPPEGALTYRRWLDEGIARTGGVWSWLVTLGVAASAGAWGIIGAFTAASGGGEVTFFGVLGATVLAPVTEEITKVAALLWVVEKRPFWLKSIAQVLLCSAAGGLVFAAIENLIYLNVYHPQGGEAFAQWRWTVCTGLHVNCSVIAGFGLVRIWDKAVRTRTRPELRLGMPMFALAMITHGLYNFGVTVAEAGGWLAFE
ncbi:MAG: PrsW family glutamic-type intramembrane protease, partial [Planctomycetota bacterium]